MSLINFKEPHMLEEFRRLKKPLVAIVCALAVYVWEKYGKEIWVTDVLRNDLTVHGLLRGCDVRTSNLTKVQRQEAADFINDNVTYDPLRPGMHCCIYGAFDRVGKHWDHFHLQSHPRTKTKFWVVAE